MLLALAEPCRGPSQLSDRLARLEGLPEETETRKDRPLPLGLRDQRATWSVYIDYLDLAEVVQQEDIAGLLRTQAPEMKLAEARYKALESPGSGDKAVDRETRLHSLGVVTDGKQGQRRLPPGYLAKLIGLTCHVFRSPKVSQHGLFVLLGRWVRVALRRRALFLPLDKCWMAANRHKDFRPIPGAIVEELTELMILCPLAVTDLRLPVAEVVTCSDASLWGAGGMAAAALTRQGKAFMEGLELRQVYNPSGDSFLIVSLFDGAGGIRAAWDALGLTVAGYAAAETDPAARRVVQSAWPDVIELGDVNSLDVSMVLKLRIRFSRVRHVLVAGGWPCQDISRAGLKAGLFGPHSSLFFVFALFSLFGTI